MTASLKNKEGISQSSTEMGAAFSGLELGRSSALGNKHLSLGQRLGTQRQDGGPCPEGVPGPHHQCLLP